MMRPTFLLMINFLHDVEFTLPIITLLETLKRGKSHPMDGDLPPSYRT